MLKFLIDEDLPRSTAPVLRKKGSQVLDVRDCGLRGQSDKTVFEFAQRESAIIISGDMGFSNIKQFPPKSHCGIVIVHFPNEISINKLNEQILKAFNHLNENDFYGNLIIIEPGKIRIRRQ